MIKKRASSNIKYQFGVRFPKTIAEEYLLEKNNGNKN